MVDSSVMTGAHDDSAFIRTCRGLPADHTPVWFMRQAGRSLPEYRAIRGSGSIVTAIRTPDLATEITLQPVRRYGTDAAILYSDIVTPIEAIGFGVDVAPGIGPVVEHPFRSAADLDRIRPLDPEADTPYVLETVRNLVGELGDVPLIGFAGAPFTVASYLVEGRPSRTYEHTKALMYTEPDLWFALLDRLADLALASLRSQVENGASAVQLFDSWAGALSPSDYVRYVQPASQKVLEGIGETGVLPKNLQREADRLLPGTILTRIYDDVEHHVLVRGVRDFEYRGQRFTSLTAVAKVITGCPWSGPLFFGLKTRSKQEAP